MLAKQGAEIIILSQSGKDLITGKDLPEYERIEGFKVRRYGAPTSVNFGQRVALGLNRRLIEFLNRRSLAAQARIGRIAPPLTVKRDAAAQQFNYPLAWFHHNRLRVHLALFYTFMKLCVRIPAAVTNRLTGGFHKLFGLLAGETLTQHVAKLAAYYRPDVIVAQDFPQLAPGVLAKKLTGAPLLYDAHELYPEIGSLTPPQKRKYRRLENKLIRRADGVYTVNTYIAKEMAKRYAVPEPDVIYNMINTPAGFVTGQHDDRLRKAAGLGPRARILLYQGWVHHARGLPEIIRALRTAPKDVHLVLLGYGEIAEMLKLAEEAGVRRRVHALPPVPWTELLEWTASADAGIIPYPAVDLNNHFCSPSKLFEYTIAGLPIIGNDLPFLRDYIVGNDFGIVGKLETEEGVAAALATMFDPKRLNVARFRENLAANAHKFSYEAQEPKLLEIYDRLPVFREWRAERAAGGASAPASARPLVAA